MTTFTPHQDSALKAVADWLKAKPGRNGTPPVFRLFGYAGTGKSTVLKFALEELGLDPHKSSRDGGTQMAGHG